MLIYDALRKDHDNLKTLLMDLVTCEPNDDEKASDLIDQIRDAMVPHSRAEEAVFYNSLRSLDAAKDVVSHSYNEHMEAESLLRRLQARDLVGADWTSTAKKLQTAVEHHIHEEEGRVFSVARQLFTTQEAEMMADAFERLKPEVQEEGLLQTSLEMITNRMPPRFAKYMGSADLSSRL